MNPLRDLCGGASLEGRELPWTRKEREGEREERKEREKRKAEEMFCRRGDVPTGLCDVLNEMLRSKCWTELTTKGIDG